jgi:hypothetical protein
LFDLPKRSKVYFYLKLSPARASMALATPAEGFSQYTGVSLFKRENIRRTTK